MTVKTFWCCSRCGGTNVETVVHLWQNPNTEEFGEVAEGWNGENYCNDCCDTAMLEPEERELEKPDSYPHYAEVAWGLRGEDDDDTDPEDVIKERYRFATKAELDAFLFGVEEGSGWLDHVVVEDSRDG